MKSLIKILILFIMIFSENSKAGGVVVGNGGDTLTCEKNLGSKFNGLFSLDYLLEFQSASPLMLVNSWNESETKILNTLIKLSPALASQFKDYVSDVLNHNSLRSRLWNETPLIETDIKDEAMLRLLPANCDPKKLKQTVIRTYSKDYVYYLYNGPIVSELRNSYPLQFSFLMVHEWLWDFTSDVRMLRKINWLIHSEKFNTLLKEEFFDILSRYNFFNKILEPCSRSANIQNLFIKSCQNNSMNDLIPETTINLSYLNRPYGFRSGDFRGLFKIEILNLSGNPNLLDFLSPFSFQDMKNLKSLNLSGNKIVEFPFWFFSDFKYLSELNLTNNEIIEIPKYFKEFPFLKRIFLTKNSHFKMSSLQNLPSQTEVIFN